MEQILPVTFGLTPLLSEDDGPILLHQIQNGQALWSETVMTVQLTWSHCKVSKQSAAVGRDETVQLVQTDEEEVTWSNGGSCVNKSMLQEKPEMHGKARVLYYTQE